MKMIRVSASITWSHVFLMATLALLLVSGCSSETVSGTVTCDGKPLEEGVISFRPAGSDSNSAGTPIEAGRFSLDSKRPLRPGKYFVTVQAFRRTGRMDTRPGQNVPEMAAVNFKETGKLEATIAAGVKNHFDFQLTSVDSKAH